MSLFRSVESALRFAFNPERVACNRPGIARQMGTSSGERSPLAGLDGAAQAGIINRRLSTLSYFQQALLIARYAPPTVSCECGQLCCAKRRPNLAWQGAIRIIADSAEKDALGGCQSDRQVLLAILAKHFGHKAESVVEVAAGSGVPRGTASNHTGKVRRWLYGEAGVDHKPGVEEMAFHAAKWLLADCVEMEATG